MILYKNIMYHLRNYKIEIWYDSAIPFLLSIAGRKLTLLIKDMCRPMFITMQFTIATINKIQLLKKKWVSVKDALCTELNTTQVYETWNIAFWKKSEGNRHKAR